jgi:hypothetical protein
MKKQLFLFILALGFGFLQMSCKHLPQGVHEIPSAKRPAVSLSIQRYEKALFTIDTTHFAQNIENLKTQFPAFLDGDIHNQENIQQLYAYVTDTQLIKLYRSTINVFADLKPEEKQLSQAFSYIKYYYPRFKIPKVYSYVSGIYYEQPVIKKRKVIIIALDDYLGQHFVPYSELHIPQYHQRCMERAYLPADVLKTIYYQDFQRPTKSRTLLDKMVEAGKQLYFLDAMMPAVPDSVKIGYTSHQLKWMDQHKRDVWAVFVKNHFIYSADYLLLTKLTQDGPFTEGFSRQSPPRMASWFGWQIVRAYMNKHPEQSPDDLFRIKDAQQILEASGYKP